MGGEKLSVTYIHSKFPPYIPLLVCLKKKVLLQIFSVYFHTYCSETYKKNTFLKTNDIFKVPEVPKKVIPEEKKPTPVPKKAEAPPPKGTLISNSTRPKRKTNWY